MNTTLKKIGFFSALILPVLLIGGFYLGGFGFWAIHVFVFLMVPLMDYLIRHDTSNVPQEAVSRLTNERFYRWVTYGWVYVQLGVLAWGFYVISSVNLNWWQWIAFCTGTALVTGGIGTMSEWRHPRIQLPADLVKVFILFGGVRSRMVTSVLGSWKKNVLPKKDCLFGPLKIK